ncbi:ECF transporter S component [Caloramator sp. E03]|uniref:ECF transporter S component n=1 Tax=Caloramator sp. E03 TaxID=2576307 RepID=UPI0011108346|nr:ECF transporter S component [Caloramator sp. E03]QCX33768.1 ECF transporter S component [Caloramator sp. E03]
MENLKIYPKKVMTVRKMTRVAMLAAIAIFMSLTPFGYIRLTPSLKVTFMHIPVIIAAITDGIAGGIIVGLIFGLSSLVNNLSTIFAPIFINPMISIFPRIMIGVFSALTYKKTKNVAITAIVGTATNTILVLSMIYVFAAKTFASISKVAIGSLGKILIGIALTNGTLEVIVAAIIVTAITKALDKIIRQA